MWQFIIELAVKLILVAMNNKAMSEEAKKRFHEWVRFAAEDGLISAKLSESSENQRKELE